jgi:hypothetical protein
MEGLGCDAMVAPPEPTGYGLAATVGSVDITTGPPETTGTRVATTGGVGRDIGGGSARYLAGGILYSGFAAAGNGAVAPRRPKALISNSLKTF